MSAAAWGLSIAIMANGFYPNPEMMAYHPVPSKEDCIQKAKDAWQELSIIKKYRMDLYTLCHAYPSRKKDDRVWIICDENMVCKANGEQV